MELDPQFVGLLQILLGAVSLFFLLWAYENQETRGSVTFAALCVGVGVYGFSSGLDHFVASYAASHFVFTFRSFGGVLITSAWLLLAMELTDRFTVSRRLRRGFAAYVALAQLFIWTDPLHHLIVGPGSTMQGTNFEPTIGVGLWSLLGIGYIATLFGTALLASDALRSTGIRRRQRTVLALAIVPTLAGSLLTVSGTARFDYTPLGYALTAFMFSWALFSDRFLDLTPVARRTALGEMSDAVVTLDDGNRVVDCNQRARDLFDVAADYAGTPAEEFFPSVVTALDGFEDLSETETELTLWLDEKECHFSLSVSPVARRKQRGRIFVLRDITDRKRREEELQRQNDRLDRFASMVGHDLRNPLTVANGQLELGEAKCDDDVALEHFEAVHRSHERMETMIDDLLMLARSGRRVEEPEPVQLAGVVQEAWTHADMGDCELELNVPEDVWISADPDRLLHVFENCLRNVADHNETPTTARIGLLDGYEQGGRADFYIEDDGAGIPEAARDRVLEHGYTTGDDGTGLGLSILTDIVEAHGWEIRVTESSSGGARFEVTRVEAAEQ